MSILHAGPAPHPTKALTICQPWAQLIVQGTKAVENRTWPTHHRGPLAIHAGSNRRWLRDLPAWVRSYFHNEDLVFGHVIGTVEVIDCLPVEEYRLKYGDNPFAVGPWCHVYANPRPLPRPVPCSGALSLWNIDPRLIEP